MPPLLKQRLTKRGDIYPDTGGYWLKAENKHLPLDAYESFSKLAVLQKISLTDLKQWRNIIGMRNALVHDYLTIDSEFLQTVMADQSYRFLTDFISHAEQNLR